MIIGVEVCIFFLYKEDHRKMKNKGLKSLQCLIVSSASQIILWTFY